MLVLPVAAWALVRAFGLDGETALVPLMAFTPWAAVGALFILGLAVALERWAASAVSAASLVLLALAVLPRAFGSAETLSADSQTLKVLSANVYKGGAEPAALVRLVRRLHPDVLAVQELNGRFVSELRHAGIDKLLPHSVLLLTLPHLPKPPDKRKKKPGIGVYSRLPLHKLARPATSASSRLQLTLDNGEALRLIDFHPLTPSPDHVWRWAETLQSLPSAGAGTPWLIVGDFNAMLDQSELREVVGRGYRDAGTATGNGLTMTWPNNRRIPPLVAIDHVLVDERLGISGYGVEDLARSDHRAIWAEVFFR
jgi:endonuclease/exonuclease/phosphatase family metal-dependent hydrolase